MRKIKYLVTGVLLAFGFMACAQAATASGTVQKMSYNILQALKKNKNRLKNKKVVNNLVDVYFLPYINKQRMAQMVVGRNYWNKSSQAQRNDFINQFKNMVISTYAAAITSYNGDKIRIYKSRGGNGGAVATVKTAIVRRNGQVIPIVYYMSKTPKGWRIYDFAVENISMVNSYRSQFAPVLAAGGMPNLISKLKNRNRRA